MGQEQGGHGTERPGHDDCGGQTEPEVRPNLKLRQTEGIGTDPKERAVPEGRQAGVAE